MIAHAEFCAPEEACGLLAGSGDTIEMVYCLTNADRSPTRYTIEPTEHFRAMRHAERMGLEIVGAFHSHPVSAAYPSVTDLRLALDNWYWFIVSLAGRPTVRAFRLEDGSVDEVELEVA